MAGFTDSVTTQGRAKQPRSRRNLRADELQTQDTPANVGSPDILPNAVTDRPHSDREKKSSTAVPQTDVPATLLETKDEFWANHETSHRIPLTRKRSDHTGRIFKALLVIAIAVATLSLVYQPSNDEDLIIGSRSAVADEVQETEGAQEAEEIDAGSPDAPPPNVLIQRD